PVADNRLGVATAGAVGEHRPVGEEAARVALPQLPDARLGVEQRHRRAGPRRRWRLVGTQIGRAGARVAFDVHRALAAGGLVDAGRVGRDAVVVVGAARRGEAGTRGTEDGVQAAIAAGRAGLAVGVVVLAVVGVQHVIEGHRVVEALAQDTEG